MLAILLPVFAALAVSPSIALPTTESDRPETSALLKTSSDAKVLVERASSDRLGRNPSAAIDCTAEQRGDWAFYRVHVPERYTPESACRRVFRRLSEMVTDQDDWICEQDGEAGTVMYMRMPSGEDNLVNAILDDEYHDIVLSSGGPGFHCSSVSQALFRRQEDEPPVPSLEMSCHTYDGYSPLQLERHIIIGLPWDPATSCRGVDDEATFTNDLYHAECFETDNNQTEWLLLTHVDDDAEWFMKILDEKYPDVVKHRNGQHFTCPTQPDGAIARRELNEPPVADLDLTCSSHEFYHPGEVSYELTIGLPYESYDKSCRSVGDQFTDMTGWFMWTCQSDENDQIRWRIITHASNEAWFNKIFDQAYPEVIQHRNGRGFDCHAPPDDVVARRDLEEPPINNLEMTCHASPGGFGDYGLLHYTVHIGVKYVSIPSVFPDHPSYNAPSCRNLFMRLHTTGAAFRGFLCHDDGHGATLWHFDADGGSSGTINRLLNEEYPEVVKHMREKHLGNGFNCPSQADQ